MSVLGNNLLAQYYAQNQGLPFGYEAVEYLASDNGAYIDTLVNGESKNLEIECEFMSVYTTLTNYVPIFYNRGSSQTQNRTRIILGNTTRRLFFNLCSIANDSGYYDSYTSGEWYKASLSFGKLMLNGSAAGTGRTVQGTPCNTNIEIFPYYSSTVTIYIRSMRIKDNGVLLRNFIPCIRKSDNKPGLYDLCRSICPLTGTPFYINAGTGEFVTP